jgi:RimJ/RimL family protein N-acetyltransferase
MNKLIIHKAQISEIDEIVSMEAEQENAQFIFPNTKEDHFKLLSDNDVEHLILKTRNNEIIGFVILAGLKNKNRSIEFRRIVIKQKGKGYGRMALKEIKHYCFEQLNCHRIWLDVFEKNNRAIHLYQSENFVEEGKLRDCILVGDEFKSLILMSILETEYRNSRSINLP